MIGLELEVMKSHPVHQTVPLVPERLQEIVEAEDDVEEGRHNGPEDGRVRSISDHGLPNAIEVELGKVCVAAVLQHQLAVVHADAGPGPQ